MNYLLTGYNVSFASGNNVNWHVADGLQYHVKPMDAAEYEGAVRGLFEMYPGHSINAHLNVLGSHDTARLLTVAGHDVASVKLAALLTSPSREHPASTTATKSASTVPMTRHPGPRSPGIGNRRGISRSSTPSSTWPESATSTRRYVGAHTGRCMRRTTGTSTCSPANTKTSAWSLR